MKGVSVVEASLRGVCLQSDEGQVTLRQGARAQLHTGTVFESIIAYIPNLDKPPRILKEAKHILLTGCAYYVQIPYSFLLISNKFCNGGERPEQGDQVPLCTCSSTPLSMGPEPPS